MKKALVSAANAGKGGTGYGFAAVFPPHLTRKDGGFQGGRSILSPFPSRFEPKFNHRRTKRTCQNLTFELDKT